MESRPQTLYFLMDNMHFNWLVHMCTYFNITEVVFQDVYLDYEHL